uniref:ubiquitin carboxyl-terminal hydrolase 47-like isoform X2 n=1 Tax=Myxine glutinosa TaxID=7769 RepID=UPI00358E2D05
MMRSGEETQLVPTEKGDAAEEARFLCIVQDSTSHDTQRYTFNLPGSSTLQALHRDIATRAKYLEGSFTLKWKHVELSQEPLDWKSDQPLMEAGFQAEQKNYLVIADKEGEQPQSAPDTSRLAVVTRQEEGNMVKSGSSHAPEGASAAGYESSAVGYSILGKSDTGYVGLVNQAMTCYLNSLLQTLYMTPEFRNALYKWEFDGTEEEGGCKSIPYQLQRLFVQLQTSWKRAVETTDLTRSFGWDSSEAWQQHDVQELCRVMFDALEQKWKNTEQADLINQLYQGKLKDYVRCLDCGYESSRLDTYLDIPLAIRPFGSNQAYCSVEEALQAFVQPETLDGINQYYCEHCGKKCDAHKGLEFLHFPYMLSLQLKRFDFDYSTMHRIKLNDRMTFPEMLDLNSFIDAPEEEVGPSIQISLTL